MSSVHSNVVLQALSTFTGANVNSLTEETNDSKELNVFNFLPTTFANTQAVDEIDSLQDSFPNLFVDLNTFLDPGFDYDFTDLKDNSKCMRGNEPYTRPCGWTRVAIKVLDKYPDGNAWLGTAGWRSYSVADEWPVSYHGTSMNSAKAIIGDHYKPGSRELYGRGIYSTYDIKEATFYSDAVTCQETGKKYNVLLQNRINPKMRKVCDRKDYWLIEIPAGTPSDKEKEIVEKSIRPYGLLLKEV
ncbi:3,7-dimethylxanthine N-methyltransferase TCS1 [Labeo rohita]|uniref:3,7-dimethylxanthine N-methyltransferase TCS1 n=1 Tax=Labeo rohita TaxID=84645 RepID=A0ABQ8L3W0_LABRO|nr:3,7-dimethylxanthine N-methyltransferase TCS1 [Labeo rohita]